MVFERVAPFHNSMNFITNIHSVIPIVMVKEIKPGFFYTCSNENINYSLGQLSAFEKMRLYLKFLDCFLYQRIPVGLLILGLLIWVLKEINFFFSCSILKVLKVVRILLFVNIIYYDSNFPTL